MQTIGFVAHRESPMILYFWIFFWGMPFAAYHRVVGIDGSVSTAGAKGLFLHSVSQHDQPVDGDHAIAVLAHDQRIDLRLKHSGSTFW